MDINYYNNINLNSTYSILENTIIDENEIERFILYLFFPTWFIFKILISSTLTSLLICKLSNKPFINPLFSNEMVIHKINNAFGVATMVIINYNIIYFSLSQYYLHNDNDNNNENNNENDNEKILHRIKTIGQFLFMLEFIAYWYHLLSHKISFIYKNSHKIHHMNIEVYPLDLLEIDYLDNIAQTLYINLPLYFVPMNINDYRLIYYIYATGAFLVHSDIFTKDHTIHHRLFKYNYGFLIPIFDILFGTYKSDFDYVNE